MSGKLIVLEGTDGSGKATQAGLLCKSLAARGIPWREIDFPRYGKPSAAMVQEYLDGKLGSHPGDVNAYAASSFYSVDRYASYKTLWGRFYHDGGTVIADRYTTSNAVHQCSKLPREEWDAYLAWLFDFEYRKIAIPEPDTVVYLDVDPEVSQRLMSQRYHGDEEKKDIHEKNMEYLQHSRQAGQYCAKALGWKRVACTEGGRMRAKEDIHKDVLALIAKR